MLLLCSIVFGAGAFSIIAGPARAATGASFAFRGPSDISRWRFEHVDEARFTGGGLFLKGNNYVRIAPPVGLKVPAGRLAMEIWFKVPKSIICNIRARGSKGRVLMKTVRVKVLDGAQGDTHLDVYLGRTGGKGAYIEDFVVEFYSTESAAVRLDSIRLYEPTAFQAAFLLFGEFWEPDFISGATVGFVTTPEAGGWSFLSMLYVFIVVAFLAVLLAYRVKGRPIEREKAPLVLVLIIIAAASLFTIRMDYNWLVIWRDDVKTLSGLDVDERIRRVNNHNFDTFLDFIAFVRESVPPGEPVRPATLGYDTPLAAIARYYMLPLENSVKARFLWSYGDVLSIDPVTGALRDAKARVVAPQARLFTRFAANAAIYEVF